MFRHILASFVFARLGKAFNNSAGIISSPLEVIEYIAGSIVITGKPDEGGVKCV
jgi:hypothetical protein